MDEPGSQSEGGNGQHRREDGCEQRPGVAEQSEWVKRALDYHHGGDEGLKGMIEAAVFRQQRIEMQQKYVARIKEEIEAPYFEIPHYFTERETFPVIEAIAEEFERQNEDGG